MSGYCQIYDTASKTVFPRPVVLPQEIFRRCSSFIAGLSLILLSVLTPVSSVATEIQLSDAEKKWLGQHHTVRVRVGSWPPIIFTDGPIRGISIDYLESIFNRHGIEYRYITDKTVSWPQALDYIRQRKIVDMTPTAKNTPERQGFMVFTRDYLFLPWVIFTRTDAPFTGTISDLYGKTVAVQDGYVMKQLIEENYPQIKLRVMSGANVTEKCMKALATGLVDAFVGNLAVGTYQIQSHGYLNVKVAAPAPFGSHNIAMSIRKDWPELAGIIDKSLATLTPEDHAVIMNKWLNVQYDYGIRWKDILLWGLAALAVMILVVGSIAFSNRQLRKEIFRRKTAQASLRASERTLSTLMGNLPGMAYRCLNNPEWTMKFVSEGVLPLTGYASEDLLENRRIAYGDIVHIDDRDRIFFEIQAALDKKEPFTITYRIVTRDNQTKWVWEQGVGVGSPNGRLERLEGFITDITDLRLAQEKLIESETRFQTLLNQMGDGVYVHDLKGNIVFVNPKACESTQYTEEELLSLRLVDLTNNPVAREQSENSFESIRSDIPVTMEGTRLRKDGSSFPVELQLVRGAFDAQEVIIALERDISEREKATRKRESLEEQLRRAHKMQAIGTLAGGIAHDFNNILASIIGYTELSLDEVRENPVLSEYLGEVFSAGKRARDLVRQILTFSRHGSNVKKPVLLPPLIREIIKMLRSTIPSSIRIEDRISTGDVTIKADPSQIHQVVVNLATNAAHAVADSKGIIEIGLETEILDHRARSRYPELEPGPYARLIVRDNGAGIPREHLDQIFDPYFTTREKEKGTGLGLAVVHGVVKAHNGHISVESEPGSGTTFHVHFPLVEEPLAESVAQHANQQACTGGHILVVDDEPAIIKMQTYHLQRQGYTVTTAANGTGALDLFKNGPDTFNLVITDMSMPDMTGDELAVEIKKIRQDIPVILCTGFSEKIDECSRSEMNIDKVLIKPVESYTMISTIRECLGEQISW